MMHGMTGAHRTAAPSPAPRWRRTLVGVGGVVAILGTLAVVIAAFTLSFDATRAVAVASRISVRLAWLMPASIDGAIAVATVSFVVMRHLGQRGVYPAAVGVSGVLISGWCNALHATGPAGAAIELEANQRMAVSAIPPVMLALSMHLLVGLLTAVVKPERTASDALDAAARPGASAPDSARMSDRRRSKRPAPRVSLVKVSVQPPAAAPSEPKRASKPTRVKGGRRTVAYEAETILRAREFRREREAAGLLFNRDAVKAEFKLSSGHADDLIKAVRRLDEQEAAEPNQREEV